jgi:hypothetical protein
LIAYLTVGINADVYRKVSSVYSVTIFDGRVQLTNTSHRAFVIATCYVALVAEQVVRLTNLAINVRALLYSKCLKVGTVAVWNACDILASSSQIPEVTIKVFTLLAGQVVSGTLLAIYISTRFEYFVHYVCSVPIVNR